MTSLTEIKNKARLHLHERAKVQALYVQQGAAFGVEITCRVHSKTEAVGLSSDMSAYKGEMPTRQSDITRIVFLRSEMVETGIDLRKNDIITLSADEAYKLDNAEPTDGITVTWLVSRLTPKQIQNENLPLPGV